MASAGGFGGLSLLLALSLCSALASTVRARALPRVDRSFACSGFGLIWSWWRLTRRAVRVSPGPRRGSEEVLDRGRRLLEGRGAVPDRRRRRALLPHCPRVLERSPFKG
uniref:Uncharacterized protein n=1 Tax=Triticum urartu TaxID=4572 RepID=A0A8R7P6J2_TRIUA